MPNFTTYKTIQVTTATPTGDGGLVLNSNFKALADADDAKANATDLTAHTTNTSNPHSVTKSQVGLSALVNALQLVASSNLSDLASASAARSNLGLGTAATAASSSFDAAGSAAAVTASLASYLTLTGGTLSGNLNLASHDLVSVGAISSSNGSWSIDGSGNAAFPTIAMAGVSGTEITNLETLSGISGTAITIGSGDETNIQLNNSVVVTHDVAAGGKITSNVQTISDALFGDTVLDASGCNQINVSNSAATLTSITGGVDGQGLSLRITGANTTFTMINGGTNGFNFAPDLSETFTISQQCTYVVMVYTASTSLWEVLAIRGVISGV